MTRYLHVAAPEPWLLAQTSPTVAYIGRGILRFARERDALWFEGYAAVHGYETEIVKHPPDRGLTPEQEVMLEVNAMARRCVL